MTTGWASPEGGYSWGTLTWLPCRCVFGARGSQAQWGGGFPYFHLPLPCVLPASQAWLHNCWAWFYSLAQHGACKSSFTSWNASNFTARDSCSHKVLTPADLHLKVSSGLMNWCQSCSGAKHGGRQSLPPTRLPEAPRSEGRDCLAQPLRCGSEEAEGQTWQPHTGNWGMLIFKPTWGGEQNTLLNNMHSANPCQENTYIYACQWLSTLDPVRVTCDVFKK